MLLLAALLGLGLLILAYPPSAFERSLQRFLASIPSWLDPVWGFFSDMPWLWACLLVVVALFRRRFFVAGQAAASLVLAVVVGIVSARLAAGGWPHLSDSIFGTSHAPGFPGTRLAEASAVMLTAAPHYVRPVRVADRWILVLGMVGTAAAGDVTPSGTLASVLVGIVAAAAVRLAAGTSIGRPGIDAVSVGVAQLGVTARDLEVADHQVAGVFLVRGVDADGKPLLIKVYGRDAYDTQFIAKLWRSIFYRGDGTRIRAGRLESAEHEALVSLLAAQGGVPTREVVTVGATVEDDALLVLRGAARPLGSIPAEELDPACLHGSWQALTRLEGRRIAHGQIDGTTLVLVDGEVGFVDFVDALVAPEADAVSGSRAQLLMTTASLFGSEPALQAAIENLGSDGVATLLPHLQTAALGGALRRRLKESATDVDEFREHAAEVLGVEAPELAKLRRVSWRAVLQIVLLGFAAYAVLSAAGGVDWSEFTSTLGDATWGWIVVGFVVAQLPRLTQALATLGSVPTALPFGPVYAMQLATGYMNLALPSNFARMAVSIRFFQRQGLSAPVAIASGTVDSFASTVIQAVLLAVLLIFSESSLALDFPAPSGGTRVLLFVLIALVVVVVLVVALVRRIRRLITENVRKWWPDIKAALVNLRSSDKLALLLLGSLATEVLFAIALGLFCRSFGYDISLAELLVINISVALLGSLVPVPGNIGVAEFGLSIGLVSAGMTDESALAAVLLYRISTFYLPPVWGFFSMLWLQRNRYL